MTTFSFETLFFLALLVLTFCTALLHRLGRDWWFLAWVTVMFALAMIGDRVWQL